MKEELGNIETPEVTGNINGENASGSGEFNLIENVGVWTKVKNFLFQDIRVELTPAQQKVEDDINDFLHQEITWKKVHSFLFKEIYIGKKKVADIKED